MNQVLKNIMVGTLPAVCGAVGMPALAEKIAWPESPAISPSFATATPSGAPATQPVVEAVLPLPLESQGVNGFRP